MLNRILYTGYIYRHFEFLYMPFCSVRKSVFSQSLQKCLYTNMSPQTNMSESGHFCSNRKNTLIQILPCIFCINFRYFMTFVNSICLEKTTELCCKIHNFHPCKYIVYFSLHEATVSLVIHFAKITSLIYMYVVSAS